MQVGNRRLIISETVKGLFILLFSYTAFSKMYSYRQFQFALSDAPVLNNYVKLISIAVPAVELLVVVCIFIPLTSRIGIIAGVGLLVMFTAYIIFMLMTDSHLPCSCGGVIAQLTWKQHILFNIFFIAAGILFIML